MLPSSLLSPLGPTKVYLYAKPADMRKSFNGLHAIVEAEFRRDIRAGDVFVFLNRRLDRIKLIHWDRDGLAIWAKKFESHCPHLLLFTGIGRYCDNLAYRSAAAVGMDSNPPRIDSRRRPMPEEISVIVPPRAEFTAGR